MQASLEPVELLTLPDTPPATAAGLVIREVARELDPEWEEAFNWSYGPRRWNVGCG